MQLAGATLANDPADLADDRPLIHVQQGDYAGAPGGRQPTTAEGERGEVLAHP